MFPWKKSAVSSVNCWYLLMSFWWYLVERKNGDYLFLFFNIKSSYNIFVQYLNVSHRASNQSNGSFHNVSIGVLVLRLDIALPPYGLLFHLMAFISTLWPSFPPYDLRVHLMAFVSTLWPSFPPYGLHFLGFSTL